MPSQGTHYDSFKHSDHPVHLIKSKVYRLSIRMRRTDMIELSF
jgi:hypothetical protein